MKINPIILEELKSRGVDSYWGVHYLIDLHFLSKPASRVPENYQKAVEAIGLVTLSKNFVDFKYPLFVTGDEPVINDSVWGWVTSEYNALFKPYGKNKNIRECVARMKKLFADNPDVRKEEVIGATKMYLTAVGDPRYVKMPHYFISKGTGTNRTEDLLAWVLDYREMTRTLEPSDRVDKTRKIQ